MHFSRVQTSHQGKHGVKNQTLCLICPTDTRVQCECNTAQHSCDTNPISLSFANISDRPACKHCFSIVSVHCHSNFLPSCLSASRSQYRQFVPHGRRPGPSHGVTCQRNDRRAKRRTARGAALMIPPSPCCPINSRPYVPPLLTCCMLF